MKTLKEKNPSIKKAISELKTFISTALFFIILSFIMECRSVNRSEVSTPQTENSKDNQQLKRFQPDLKNRKTVFAGKEIDKKEYNTSPDTVPVPVVSFDMRAFFPEEGKKNFIGTQIIQLECYIDEAGALNRAEIISGPEPYGFNEAALEIARQLKFIPAQVRKKNVKSKHIVPVNFSLNEG